MIRTSLSMIALAVTMSACSEPAKLECPKPQPVTTSSVLKETAADIEGLKSMLAEGASGNAVSEIIFNLRKKYPKVSNAEISNYLTIAYCPVVAAQDRTIDDAKAKLESFNAIVEKNLSQ